MKFFNKEKPFILHTIFILAVTIVSAVFFLYYELNDDMMLQLIMSQSASTFSPYTHRIGFWIVRWLNLNIPIVAWHPVMLVIGNTLSWVVLSRLLIKNAKTTGVLKLILILLAFDLAFYICQIQSFNFTRTAAALGVAAAVMLWNRGYFFSKDPANIASAALLLLFGCFIRTKGGLVGSIFCLGVMVLTDIIKDLRDTAAIRRIFRSLICPVITIAAVLGFVYASDELLATPEIKEFMMLEDERDLIVDYSRSLMFLPEYEGYEAVYSEYGIYDNDDLDFIKGLYYSDWDICSYDNLHGINSLRELKIVSAYTIFKRIRHLFYQDFLWIATIGIVFLTMIMHPKQIPQILAVLLCTAALLLFFAVYNRLKPRAMDFSALIVILTCLGIFEKNDSPHRTIRIFKVISLCAIIWGLGQHCIPRIPESVEVVMNEKAQSALDTSGSPSDDLDHLYLITYGSKFSDSSRYTIWEPIPDGVDPNLVYLSGWEERLPYLVDKLARYGITENPIKEMVDNDIVYTIYDERVYEYLKRNYYPNLECKEVGEMAGETIIQYISGN